MILKSFGCSFIFGTDLPINTNDGPDFYEPQALFSRKTWPALLAKDIGIDYISYAKAGCGNLRILERVLMQAAVTDPTIFVIGWTWIDRYDYTDSNDTWNSIVPVDTTINADFYYRNLHSQYRDKLTTLVYIKTAIDTLNQRKIPFMMTYMDDLILEDKWHTNPGVIELQNYVRPYLTQFEGQSFLDWSRSKQFPISAGLHPLEEAHTAAAKLILSEIRKDLNSFR